MIFLKAFVGGFVRAAIVTLVVLVGLPAIAVIMMTAVSVWLNTHQ